MTSIRADHGVTNRLKIWWRERGTQKTAENTGAESQGLAYNHTGCKPKQSTTKPEILASPLHFPEGLSVLLRTRAINSSDLTVQGREEAIPCSWLHHRALFTRISCLVSSHTIAQIGSQRSSPILTPPTFFFLREREFLGKKKSIWKCQPESGWERIVPSKRSCS